MSDMRVLYQEVILEHNKKPRNFGKLEPCTHHAHGHNPLCGDTYTIYAVVNEDTIQSIMFEGDGCAISKASASMMTSRAKGKKVKDVEELIEAFREMMTVEADRTDGPALELSPENEKNMRHLQVFEGVAKLPSRIKCAILPWHALSSALKGESESSTEGDNDEWETI